jgi:CRISPR-associated protein Cmr6
MAIAAVPNYIQKDDPEFYLSAPPGHRFLLYFAAWGENQELSRVDWGMKDRVPKMRRVQGQVVQQGWENLPNDQFGCTIAACKTPQYDEEKPRVRKPKTDPGMKPWYPMMEALLGRQTAAMKQINSMTMFCQEALATAPFTTGLDNKHPLENGFAFLNPYGLPYLAGSGVKGVLRQAARELVSGEWGDTHGWNSTAITALFGRESDNGDTDHLRGALSFWDVIPQIAGDSLAVEIMTPHQGHYYQQNPQAGSATPHESGQPIPISFLTVPPKSRFVFHVQCNLAHLNRIAPELAKDESWKTLLETAFQHAYQWLGFGAKTAVGYGAMHENPEAQAERERQQAAVKAEAQRQADEAHRATLSPEDLAWEEHQPIIEGFRLQFENASKTAYKPGSPFDNQRNEFMKTALTWEDVRSRETAGDLLKATMTKAWGTPGNKDSKQRLKEAATALAPETQ